MSTGRADLTVEGAVALLAFTNPDQGFMDASMEQGLLEAVLRVEEDPGIRACILAGGQPGVFIRHYDLKPLAARAAAMAARGMEFSEARPVREGPIHEAMRRMETGTKAYVAALNGTALGGGFELALACDLRVVQAGPHVFGLPEINLGILPGAGGTQRLPRLVGEARALEMTLLGETLDPEAMVAAGLALGRPEPDALAAARRVALRLVDKPPRALSHIKRLVRGQAPGGFEAERTLFCDLMVQPEARRLLAEGAAGRRRITDAPG